MRQTRRELLSRVDIAQPLGVVLRGIARHYGLGSIQRTRLIAQGYDDLNVLLVCDRGRYVAKFFNKAKSIATIEDHVRVQWALAQRHVPVPRILAIDGAPLLRVVGHVQDTYISVSEFFAGENFARNPPQLSDMLAIARFLAALHRLTVRITPGYDSWGTVNLAAEFERKQTVVSAETRRLIAPSVEAIKGMKFGTAQRRVIHGDLQRAHVLRDDSGRLCILDFGCIDHSFPIIDLAVFLALFCLEGSEPSQAYHVIDDVLTTYQRCRRLTSQHIGLLGPLIRATWAIYLLNADFLIRQGDRSRQTSRWYRSARTNLRAFEGRF